MSLEFIESIGSALPDPFVKFELEKELLQRGLLVSNVGSEGKELQEKWEIYRRKLRALVNQGGSVRVLNHVLEPLTTILGYTSLERMAEVQTREGMEDGGYLFNAIDDDLKLRVWSTDFDLDLEAPSRRGYAYRYSPVRISQRVLLASGERLGLLTNGTELRLLISDPARPDSQVVIPLDLEWRKSRIVPDSFRLVLALASPLGLRALPEIIEKARLMQAKVTADLRLQARQAIEKFIQDVLDNPDNYEVINGYEDKNKLAQSLWREGLIIVYRLLFIFKLESTDDLAQNFSFASSSLWRSTYSPSTALAPIARAIIDEGAHTGNFMEQGMRTVFQIFTTGVASTEINVRPLGGALFGGDATPILLRLTWGEKACANILDCLLWTPKKKGSTSRERVHYGPLNIEDLGRVYEALLELEAGIATEPMCRLRRQKLEVVVPLIQGEKYRTTKSEALQDENDLILSEEESEEDQIEDDAQKGKKTKVEWVEAIPIGNFYLRVGLGRKATGSYYTPHSFVRFLVQETLGVKVAEVSPHNDPNPNAILSLKVLDPAMGSGHFLVEVCRFLGEALYEACRLCDDLTIENEAMAEKELDVQKRAEAFQEAEKWRKRVIDIPDPNDELMQYLPSRAPEGAENGLSEAKASALCRRLVAVHCLYGVDKNPLAVELAKLSLWMVSHAEGLPLTFLDHRLVLGDSLTGPFFEHLLKYPGTQEPLDNLFSQGLEQKLKDALAESLKYVMCLESSIGVSIPETEAKQEIKSRLDMALLPFRIVAAAWAGGVMLGPTGCDDKAYEKLITEVVCSGKLMNQIESKALKLMIAKGLGVESIPESSQELLTNINMIGIVPALPYDLAFPEVFYPSGYEKHRSGFDAVLGNPPWEGIDTSNKEFFAAFDFSIMDSRTDDETKAIVKRLLEDPEISSKRAIYDSEIQGIKNTTRCLLSHINMGSKGASAATPDLYQCFAERAFHVIGEKGLLGMVIPAAFHANEGATGLRRLYLTKMYLKGCYSFENRKKLFEIDSRFKFVVLMASKENGGSKEFPCAFYLIDDQWLFAKNKQPKPLTYNYEFIKATTGNALNFLELRDPVDVEPTMVAYACRKSSFGDFRRNVKVTPTEELHKGKQKWRFVQTESIMKYNEDPRLPEAKERALSIGYLSLVEGKTFHQFTDIWEERPEFVVPLERLKDKISRLHQATTYRLAFRKVASSTNERTGIFSILPPLVVCTDSALVESKALERKTIDALVICGLANCFTFDWLLRQMVAANVQFSFLDLVPVPDLRELYSFLGHSTTRLVCNHSGYEPLWYEQLGDAWREMKAALSWPVLESGDERWMVRAAIDAVVANAYGLNREQYVHVLSSFSHKSYPKAPKLCLSMYDELVQIGMEAFTHKYDPYWDIPLNEKLPQPAITLPDLSASLSPEVAESPGAYQASLFAGEENPTPKRGGNGRTVKRK